MNSQWISAEKELPEIDEWVLAFMPSWEGPRVAVRRMYYPSWEESNSMPYSYWDDPHNDGQDWDEPITHWQPLPQQP